MSIDQVTCMVGDNAFFNDALARWLGIPRLRCLPHACQLVWLAVTSFFPLFATCTSGISALLGAGGGTSRKDLVRKQGMKVESLHCVVTRWGQTDKVASYLLEDGNFEKLRGLIKSEPVFAAPKKKAGKRGAAAAEEEEHVEDAAQEVQVGPGGRRVTVGSVLQNCRAAFEVDVAEGSRSFEALLQLHLVRVIAPKVTEIITRWSATVANTDYEAGCAMLQSLEQSMADAADDGNQDAVIEQAIENAQLNYSKAERTAVSFCSPLSRSFISTLTSLYTRAITLSPAQQVPLPCQASSASRSGAVPQVHP